MTAGSAAATAALEHVDPGGTYVGRVWDPRAAGPSPVLIDEGVVWDISAVFPTMRDLTEHDDPAQAANAARGPVLGPVEEMLVNSWHDERDPARPWFLSPFDLHVVKATGVTFAASMIERVIEERALGDAERAARIRSEVGALLGGDLASIVPGSDRAVALRGFLVDRGMWSQYLEVGIGPLAEIFTKAPCLSTVGFGAWVGVAGLSEWNNPEPELVLAVSSRGRAVAATIGNDVNLRDVEGRSALLLGKAKDNNASAAIGPWLRLFDGSVALEEVLTSTLTMVVTGDDGYRLEARADMSRISRRPEDLVAQLLGRHHQYPDGAALYLGTPFAPVDDRDGPGRGFTHHMGDVVSISTPLLGALVNQVQRSEDCPPWEFGIRSLMSNLAHRGLLTPG